VDDPSDKARSGGALNQAPLQRDERGENKALQGKQKIVDDPSESGRMKGGVAADSFGSELEPAQPLDRPGNTKTFQRRPGIAGAKPQVGRLGSRQPGAARDNARGPSAESRVSFEAPEPKSAASQESLAGLEVLKPGDRIEKYEIICLIGQGGMGSVYKARDTVLPRHVAIKLLRGDQTHSSNLLKEAQATAQVAHENIVTIHDVGQHRDRLYIVFEHIEGTTLRGLLEGNKPLAPGRAVELAIPIVKALIFAHARGVVHRDLKPDNIMVTRSGTVKVLDFGIAKIQSAPSRPATNGESSALGEQALDEPVASDDDTSGAAGKIQGTFAWMAPEQFEGSAVDARADIFATGLILFRMLAGRHPLGHLRGMQYAVVAAQLDEPLPRLGNNVPPGLADVVARCLEKRKEKRFPEALALLRALEPFLPGRAGREQTKVDQNPYPGLSSFQELDADFFFGRAQETAALVNRVRDCALTVLTGASGVGKTSLTRAALFPALKCSGEGWEVFALRPGRDPLAALAAVLSQVTGEAKTGSISEDLDSQAKLVEKIRAEPGFPGRVLRALAARWRRRVLVCIDQFEEVFTLCSETERQAFTACLAGIADDPSSPLRLLLALRADFLNRLAEEKRLAAELGPALFFLATPDASGLREAIEEPAAMAGYRFERGIVEEMLARAQAAPAALPLLQFAASRLWEERDAANKLLTSESYQAMGGIAGALARHADTVLASLSEAMQSAARDLFLRLVSPDRTSAVVALEDLREHSRDRAECEQLVEQLVHARLLVVEKSERGSTVEIVHDSLIRDWPKLARWIDDAGEDLGFVEQLSAATRLWVANQRDQDLLWRGDLVQDARRFQRRFRGELSRMEREFLEETFRLDARAARRKRARVVGIIASLATLVAASFVALAVIASAEAKAKKEAELATIAETQARERLAQVQRKERERAEAARRAEEARQEVKKANEDLRIKNQQLIDALEQAQEAWRRANAARASAVASSAAERRARDEARMSEEQALRAAQELEIALRRERQRVERLQSQFGSLDVSGISD
jgi:serine/threonine protein kinase